MKQPELGKKITKLRKQKGLTQEELAYRSHINVRSIQRIEAGEVTPRISTLLLLSKVLETELHSDAKATADPWLLTMHLSSIVPLVILPLVIWIWKREEIPEMSVMELM